jgi:outer membrane protein assembly factor BamB
MKIPLWISLVAIGSLSCGAALADDWPGFRGPTGQGISGLSGLPVEWDKAANVMWKQPIPGEGWSSPIVAEGRIYLTASVPVPQSEKKDRSLVALCLDSATGKVLWEKEVFLQDGKSPRPHPKNSHASPTPLIDHGRLYVHFGHHGTACLDLEGNIIWRNTDLKYAPVHGNGGSPILVNDTIVFSCDGGEKRFVVALDCETGKKRWLTERTVETKQRFSFSTPLLITVNGQQQIISSGSNVVSALDAQTGQEIWQVKYKGYSVIPRPVYGHGLVFISTGFDSPGLIAVRPDGKGDVTKTHVAWTIRKGAPLTPSPLLVGDELYLISDSGIASCLDAKTGKVHWQERIEGNYSASPVYADGRIYYQNETGTGTVLRAEKKFEVLARKNRLEARTLASYAVADGSIFIRTDHDLYRIATQKQ